MENSTQAAQYDRATAFKQLHERPGLFLIPNPWDAGSAKLLRSLGFEALATTSAGLAFSLGRPDAEGAVTREEALVNVRSIVAATPLPVAADLENGYGDDPGVCAETILLGAAAGLVGGSIEDATGRLEDPIYPMELAVQRVKAAVSAARSLPFPFMLTARAENFLHGRPDLNDTIRRLEAFADAGADVLYAPGLKTRDQVQAVVQAVVPRPVNVLYSMTDASLSLDDLAGLGVKRLSVGGLLARAAYGAFLRAAEGLRRNGDMAFAEGAASSAMLNDLFRRG